MKIVDRECDNNVKVPNSVIVSGITETELDEEVIDFLNKYGHLTRVIRLDNPESPYHKNVIVEYESEAAMNALQPILPHSYENPGKVTYQIRAL